MLTSYTMLHILLQQSAPCKPGLSEYKYMYVSHKGSCHAMVEIMFTQDNLVYLDEHSF